LSQSIRLTIAEPCKERWDEMKPIERGAYCNSCCKTVTDFSAMSDKDILDYFGNRKGQQVCGRFRNEQLNRPIIYISPEVFTMDIPLWKKFLAALFICFSVFMTGCTTEKEPLDKLELDNPIVVQQAPDSVVCQTPPAKKDQSGNHKKDVYEGITLGFVNIVPDPPPVRFPAFLYRPLDHLFQPPTQQ
jgi:hypothetical protein